MGIRNDGIMISGQGRVSADQLAVGRNARAEKNVLASTEEGIKRDAPEVQRPLGDQVSSTVPAYEGTGKRLLLFVHGLGGEGKVTWGRFPEFLLGDDREEGDEIGYYSFPTSLFVSLFLRGCRNPRISSGPPKPNRQ